MDPTQEMERFAQSLSGPALGSVKNYAAVCAYFATVPKTLLDSLQKNLSIAPAKRGIFEQTFAFLVKENQDMIKSLNEQKLPVYVGPAQQQYELIEALASLKSSLTEEEFHLYFLKSPEQLQKLLQEEQS